MKIYVGKDYQQMSRTAANIVSAQIIIKPDSVLGLATGNTPIGVYKQLVAWYKKGDLDFSRVKTINLDEYRGLSPENQQSYYFFMYDKLYSHVNIDERNVNIPNGMENDCERECERYNRVISNLGEIDLQILGLGHNAHIGFNEPGEFFMKETHCVTLSPSTMKANSRLFSKEESMPKQAYTMGIGSIMKAKKNSPAGKRRR